MSGKTIEAGIRIKADTGGAAKAMRDLRNSTTELQEATKGTAGNGKAFASLREGAKSLSENLADARNQLLGFLGVSAGVAGLVNIGRIADEYAGMTARLRIVTKGQDEFNQALANAKGLASDYQQPLQATASLYTRLLSSIRPLGGGLQEAQVATEALLAALKISGATAAEAGSAILQFSQALGAGALRGEEFNAIAEAAPRLLDALAQGLGKPRDQLKSLAEEGKLTTNAVVKALRESLPSLQQEAAQLPATIGGAFQKLGDAYRALIGQQAEGSAGITAIVRAVNSLADNLPRLVSALTALGLAFGALKLGGLAGSLMSVAIGVTSVATVVGPLTVALRGLLALIGGPVGLVVALTSLVVGWDLLDQAKRKATARTADTVRGERDAVQRELDELLATRKRVGTMAAPELNFSTQEAAAKLKRLDSELKQIEQAAAASARPASAAGGTELRDPRTITEFEKDNESKLQVAKRFADQRAAYILAKDTDIAAARLAGNRVLEAKLQREKVDALAVQRRQEEDALRRFDADQTVTRLATYKERYSSIEDLAADSNARQLKLNQELFDQGLRDAKDYFEERARLETAASDRAIRQLEAEVVERGKVLEKNQALLRKARTANDREAARDAVTEAQSGLDRATAAVEKARRDATDHTRERITAEESVTRELRSQADAIDMQIKKLRGTVTLADARKEIEDRHNKRRQTEFTETGSTNQTDALIAEEVRVDQLSRKREEYGVVMDRVRLAQDAISSAEARGAITTLEADREKKAVRDRELGTLRDIVGEMDVLAKTPGEKNMVTGLKGQVEDLAASADTVTATLNKAAEDGAKAMFKDFITGAKSAGEAFRGFIATVAGAVLDIVAKNLGQQLANSLFPPSGGGGGLLSGIGSLVTSFVGLFHSGGVVGSSGAGRQIPTALALAGAAYAPRYHSGGIPGLRPDEQLAVLQHGEEVLTADSPRHVKNYRGGGSGPVIGSLNVSVSMDGSNDSQPNAAFVANGLARGVKSLIEDYIIMQMRPGGLLAGRVT